MAVQQLTPREGRSVEGPYEGVPAHLRRQVIKWLKPYLGASDPRPYVSDPRPGMVDTLALSLRIGSESDGSRLGDEILRACIDDQEYCLDVIHLVLQLHSKDVDLLEALLAFGGSAWTATETGLRRRVDPSAAAAFERAREPADIASTELTEAWNKAYGRHPDPSDAWDHAIKAVEALLIPVVVPSQDGPHLGHVMGQLDKQGERWNTLLRFNQTVPPVTPPTTPVQALVGMLRLLYPNPDRHTGSHHRVPTLEEARAVVQLAVAIVQWARDGQIVRR